MNSCRKLSFREIPGTSKLFLDFLFDFEKVAGFYCADYKKRKSFQDKADRIGKREYPRQELVSILEDQNRKYGSGQKAFENISKLANNRTCVACTGQQVGLLTGPLLTIYKALTVIKLADFLSTEIGTAVIPIFWMASDDHDFEEIRRIHLLDSSNRLVQIAYQPDDKPINIPMGQLTLDNQINGFLEQAFACLPQNAYRAEIDQMARQAYRAALPISEAFGRLMGALFSDSGLVLIDPTDVRIKQLAGPVFEREIIDFNASSQSIQRTNFELERQGYHVQVHRPENYLNLFYYDGERRRIGHNGASYFVDGSDREYSQAEILELLRQSPELFSPNALLRPIMEDFIFPTLAYSGGPAEVAYFAQIKELHNWFDVPCPIVYPRISATLMDAQAGKTLEKYNLTLASLLEDKSVQAQITRVIEEGIPVELKQKLGQDRIEIANRVIEIEKYLGELDDGVRRTVESAKGKIDYELQSLGDKIVKAYKKKNEAVVYAIQRTANFLFPESSLQERYYNVLMFIGKYGPGLINQLSKHLRLDAHDHQVVCLEDCEE